MNRYSTSLLVFGLLVIVFAVTLYRAPDKQVVKSALIGKPAPVFTLPNLLEPESGRCGRQLPGQR
jgi:hypothetical protein